MVSFRKPVHPPIFIGDSKMGGPPAWVGPYYSLRKSGTTPIPAEPRHYLGGSGPGPWTSMYMRGGELYGTGNYLGPGWNHGMIRSEGA